MTKDNTSFLNGSNVKESDMSGTFEIKYNLFWEHWKGIDTDALHIGIFRFA